MPLVATFGKIGWGFDAEMGGSRTYIRVLCDSYAMLREKCDGRQRHLKSSNSATLT